ncbi:MAG: hypothetical protein E7A62_05370 [Actinomycetaceae bacterium]|nr:hypothetical protein [Actinomycetaceae bacterium]MDU0970414.1 hypothetical protein [Actinomycetaceae bacterium]
MPQEITPGGPSSDTPKLGLPVGDVSDTQSIPAYHDEEGDLPETIPPERKRRGPVIVGYVLLIVMVLVLAGVIWAMATGKIAVGGDEPEETTSSATQPSITMSTPTTDTNTVPNRTYRRQTTPYRPTTQAPQTPIQTHQAPTQTVAPTTQAPQPTATSGSGDGSGGGATMPPATPPTQPAPTGGH